jgi:hypothetical protein
MTQLIASAELIDNTTDRIIGALVADVVALRTALVGITAKLDADAGVTDTTYGSLWNPVASRIVP